MRQYQVTITLTKPLDIRERTLSGDEVSCMEEAAVLAVSDAGLEDVCAHCRPDSRVKVVERELDPQKIRSGHGLVDRNGTLYQNRDQVELKLEEVQ